MNEQMFYIDGALECLENWKMYLMNINNSFTFGRTYSFKNIKLSATDKRYWSKTSWKVWNFFSCQGHISVIG